ncbi:MAG: hypothetical protein V5A52_00200 [Halovenus sp.]|uniref:hypothetical protein n=1 Tax=Halovenus amylolytica TaxID=2500550 RepID=UPI000FE3BB55
MAVVDSSALIPLSWVGRLDLIDAVWDERRTTEAVREEVLTEGKPGTAALKTFLEDVQIDGTPPRSEAVAELEGVGVTDASVVLLADETETVLLANDKALVEVARTHGVECWWGTTVLLKCTKDGIVSPEEAKTVLYDLVDEGMNRHPKVYTQVQKKLDELGA